MVQARSVMLQVILAVISILAGFIAQVLDGLVLSFLITLTSMLTIAVLCLWIGIEVGFTLR